MTHQMNLPVVSTSPFVLQEDPAQLNLFFFLPLIHITHSHTQLEPCSYLLRGHTHNLPRLTFCVIQLACCLFEPHIITCFPNQNHLLLLFGVCLKKDEGKQGRFNKCALFSGPLQVYPHLPHSLTLVTEKVTLEVKGQLLSHCRGRTNTDPVSSSVLSSAKGVAGRFRFKNEK